MKVSVRLIPFLFPVGFSHFFSNLHKNPCELLVLTEFEDQVTLVLESLNKIDAVDSRSVGGLTLHIFTRYVQHTAPCRRHIIILYPVFSI